MITMNNPEPEPNMDDPTRAPSVMIARNAEIKSPNGVIDDAKPNKVGGLKAGGRSRSLQDVIDKRQQEQESNINRSGSFRRAPVCCGGR